jgi:DinB superfamily
MMSDRANALADQFERANGQLVAMLEGLSDEQWQNTLDGEGWPVRVGACHIAEHYNNLALLVDIAANGKPIPDWAPKSAGDLDKLNAEIAARNAGRGREDAFDMLRSNAAKVTSQLKSLSDDQLDRQFTLPIGGEFSVEQIAQMMLIGHIGMHAPSIQKAAAS